MLRISAGIYPVFSGAGPALVADNSRSFAQGDELVGGNLLVLFVQSIGPVDVEIHRIESTQAEMQAGIAARVKARLAKMLCKLLQHNGREERHTEGSYYLEWREGAKRVTPLHRQRRRDRNGPPSPKRN